MTTATERHRHLERHPALRRRRRGGRAGRRARGARLLGAVDPRRRRRRVRPARQPARGDDDGDDRHRHPQRLDAHAGGDGGRSTRGSTAEHGRRFLCGIGISHRPFIDHVNEPGTYRSRSTRWPATSTASTPPRRRWRRPTGCSPRSARRCSSSPAPARPAPTRTSSRPS